MISRECWRALLNASVMSLMIISASVAFAEDEIEIVDVSTAIVEESTEPPQSEAPAPPTTEPLKSEVPPPTINPPMKKFIRHGYTGLIVNCKGLGLKSAMSPIIKNTDGEPVYGHKNINPDFVVAYGMVNYADDINGNDTVRAGNNPLIVMAVSVADHNSNPVISVADAKRVLDENQSSGFLDKYCVVLLW